MKAQKIERIKQNHIGYKIEFQVSEVSEKRTGTLIQIGKSARAGWITIVCEGETIEIHTDHVTRVGGKFF